MHSQQTFVEFCRQLVYITHKTTIITLRCTTIIDILILLIDTELLLCITLPCFVVGLCQIHICTYRYRPKKSLHIAVRVNMYFNVYLVGVALAGVGPDRTLVNRGRFCYA